MLRATARLLGATRSLLRVTVVAVTPNATAVTFNATAVTSNAAIVTVNRTTVALAATIVTTGKIAATFVYLEKVIIQSRRDGENLLSARALKVFGEMIFVNRLRSDVLLALLRRGKVNLTQGF